MKALFVIPARGGSKGIPKKNIRLINEKPLIAYAIEHATRCKEGMDADIVVNTDDEEIAHVSSRYGAEIVMRPAELALDHITLDPVIMNAVEVMEERKGYLYDVVITMQPTSPTLKTETLKAAIDHFRKSGFDTMISVVNKPHLSWKNENGRIIPNYTARLNRQQLQANYLETGGFLITRRECCTVNSRIGENIGVYEISEEEAIDIDSTMDWYLCEGILKRKKILFRVDGMEKLGMGHIYRCITLAYQFTEHEVMFVTKEGCDLGIEKLKSTFFPMKIVKDDTEFFKYIREYQPDIVVNDILNTTKEYMLELKKLVARVVNFEDIGDGAAYADAVINALYENDKVALNTYNGFEYFYIRDEFLEEAPNSFHDEVKNVLIMFGGSDPSNLTAKIYRICQQIYQMNEQEYPELEFHIITGIGYRYRDSVKDDKRHHIYIHHDVRRVSEYMAKADLAITSQGRTIYELACMGVPSIVLAQNKRETEHVFANLKNGFINLGIGEEQDSYTISSTINWLLHTPQVRREMHNQLMTKDFHQGQKRVRKLILGN